MVTGNNHGHLLMLGIVLPGQQRSQYALKRSERFSLLFSANGQVRCEPRYPAMKLWATLSVGYSLRDPSPYSKILVIRDLWFGRAEGGAGGDGAGK